MSKKNRKRQKLIDICRLCGEQREMSYEHIPPEKAFNASQRRFHTMRDLIYGGHSKFRKGVGIESLCSRCNNKTGGDYATAYIEWAKQGMNAVENMRDNQTVTYPFTIQPLNVLKQICVMTLAMLSPNVIDKHQDLRHFVQNRESKDMPIKYGVYVYMTDTNSLRFESEQVVASLRTGEQIFMYTEIAFPPFGLCVIPRKGLLAPKLMQEYGLKPIDWFCCFDFNETFSLEMRLPKLSVYTQFPLDYRTKEQVEKEILENDAKARSQNPTL